MTENEMKPSIRFKGFTDAWEQRKFDEVVSRIGTGLNPRDNFVLNNGGENYYVTIKNFEHGHLCLDNGCDKVDDEALKLIQARSDLKVNDILFTSIGRIGDCYLIAKQPQNWNINESVFTLRPNQIEVEPEYLFHVIHSEKVLNQILSDVTGSTFKSIKIGDLKKTDIPKPSKSEQLKIAHFATKLENIITLHQRKCDKLQDLKKSLLEKMFPAEGSNTPSIRFKGFTDAWEQRELGQTVQITMGTSPDGSTYSDTASEHILIQGNADLVDGWVCPRVWTTQVTKKADAGDLIMSVRAPAGAMGKTAFDAVIGRGVAAIKGNEFIFQTLNKMNSDGYWKKLSAGSTFESLNSDAIKTAEIKVPDIKEQKKIGDLLFSVDSLITLHQRKCEKLKNLKKSLLEKMFV